MRTRRGVWLILLGAIAAAVLAAAVASGGSPPQDEPSAGAWRGLVGEQPVDAAVGQRVVVVLRFASLADRVGRAGGRANERDERRWTREARAQQDLFVRRMNAQLATIRREHSYVLALNAFSAALDPGSIALLERAPEVEGVYPVRASFPAEVEPGPLDGTAFGIGSGRRPEAPLSGYDGHGVIVALLDTGVDRRHPYVSGRVQEGVDVLGGSPGADAARRPDDAAVQERHGTELAGILVGAAGPGGLRGVAPSASVLPIRVGGWQRDVRGQWAIYSRTDLVLAGLEHAVDPNGDGDAHDAARIALVGMVEPFSAFAGGPLARAARGAMRLDTLVVAPAGNDGPLGPAFGSVAGPGGAADVLTVGAADLRVQRDRAEVVIRTGLRVLYAGTLPLAGAMTPDRPVTAAGATGRTPGATALEDFFDRRGYSLVAGRIAFVPASRNGARPVIEAAARAGAAGVIVYGGALPAGGLGLDERVPIPVVSVSRRLGRAVVGELRRGADVGVSFAPAAGAARPAARRVAAFSSRGLAFDGGVKPELVGGGVEVATSEPGRGTSGPRFGTVNGSSASAAVVAGAAALLAQARPELGAGGLKGALVGSARPLRAAPLTAQGNGLIDVERAVRTEVVAAPAALAFPRATRRGWRVTRTVSVRNVSTRRLRVDVVVRRDPFPAAATLLRARPRRLVLAPGATRDVRVTARVPLPTAGGPPAEGALVLRPRTGVPVRVPFAIAFARRPPQLLGATRLVPAAFEPSSTAPAVLSVQAGRVRTAGGREQVQALARLDIELWTEDGKRMGALAVLRNVLPGRYAFGITGRDPGGGALESGRYLLRLVAKPTGGGGPSVRTLQFEVK